MGRRNRHKQSTLPPIVQTVAAPLPQEPEWTPTMSLDRQIARARRGMGEAKWQRLNAEWGA